MSEFQNADFDEEVDFVGGTKEEESDSDDDVVMIKPKVKVPVKPKTESDDEEEEEVESESDAGSEYDSDASSSDDEEPGSSSKEVGALANPISTKYSMELDEEDEDEEEEDDHYLQKFDESIKTNIIAEYHPELNAHNNEEVELLSRVVRNENGQIIDPLHRTVPFITKYEKARVLGERAKQLNSGAKPFVEVEPSVLDGYLIALKEFEEKKIPFILKRPLPNGGCEYWKMKDLEVII
jgi:DNA-directed RNA polymerase I, II, and III subunit RPABC2